MSNPGEANDTPVTSIGQLAEFIAGGCKPKERFRLGTEHEKFGFRLTDRAPPPYAAADDQPGGIRAVLEALLRRDDRAIEDAGNIIGLTLPDGGAVSLEPAGQLELSGAPLADLHATHTEFTAHFAQIRAVSRDLGLGWLPLGFHPTATRTAMPWMPKARYAIMRRYMPLVGSLGLDMMTRTCTVQVNLDYASEQDMRDKLRVGLLLQPLATALFANSPFTEGRPNGFQSYRAQIWTDTDNQRAGIPPVMFEDGFGFERYAEWLVDHVPMYFVSRNGRSVDVAGSRFRDFMAGRLDGVGGVATIGDFADHMTTVFTDVRLKRFLEMRGADAGSPAMMTAMPAFWVGLLYDDTALADVLALLRGATWQDATDARAGVPLQGLSTAWRGTTLADLARDVVTIARSGLRSRARRNNLGQDESIYLAPLEAIADGAPTQANHWLQRYHSVWNRDIGHIFAEAAI